MNYELANLDGNVMVRLHDDLTFDDHQKFRDVLGQLTKAKCTRCVFDLSDLTSVDSAGLGMLMIAYHESRQNAWSMVLQGPRGQVKRLLEITDLGKVVKVQ